MGPRSPEHRPARLRVHPFRRVRLGPARAVRGKFDFAWLDRAVDLAARAGLKVILCTPTPCPPAWLGEKFPEIYLVRGDGRRMEHGTRANGSLANDVFVRYTKRIVEELGRRYGRDPRVWGWQLDNEPYGPADYSPSSRRAFQAWLERKYGTVERMNAAWGGAFWSTRYDSFTQVLIPNEDALRRGLPEPPRRPRFPPLHRRHAGRVPPSPVRHPARARPARAVDHDELHEHHRFGRPAPDRPARLHHLHHVPRARRRVSRRARLPAGRSQPHGHGRRLLPVVQGRHRRHGAPAGPGQLGPHQSPARARGRPDVALARLRRRASRSPAPTATASRSSAASSTTRGSSGRTASRRRGAARNSSGSSPRCAISASSTIRPRGCRRGSRRAGPPSSGATTSCGTSRPTGRPRCGTPGTTATSDGRDQGGRSAPRLRRRGRRLRGLSLPGRPGLPARRRGPRREVDALRRGRRPPRPDLPHGTEGAERPAAGSALGRARGAARRGRGRALRQPPRRPAAASSA